MIAVAKVSLSLSQLRPSQSMWVMMMMMMLSGKGENVGGVGRLIVGVEDAGGRSTSAVVDAVRAKPLMHEAQRRRLEGVVG